VLLEGIGAAKIFLPALAFFNLSKLRAFYPAVKSIDVLPVSLRGNGCG
jgi:hypothetical protein